MENYEITSNDLEDLESYNYLQERIQEGLLVLLDEVSSAYPELTENLEFIKTCPCESGAKIGKATGDIRFLEESQSYYLYLAFHPGPVCNKCGKSWSYIGELQPRKGPIEGQTDDAKEGPK